MSRTPTALATALGMVLLGAHAAAHAQFRGKPPQLKLNGTVEVANFPCGGGEFPPAWTKQLSFVEAPDIVCVRWSGKSPATWAKWELYKVVANDDDPRIAHGDVPAASLPSGSSSFQITGLPTLPRYNTGGANQNYRVTVSSRKTALGETYTALPASLIHLPRPAPANPYGCSSGPSRRVTVEIPRMTVKKTSSTGGDGDRDEMYAIVERKGPGGSDGVKYLPAKDNYYEAKFLDQVGENEWTDRDEEHVGHPKLWSGVLAHDQRIKLRVDVREQDNADLKDIKTGLVSAFSAVAAAGSTAGGPYGAVVAGVAGAAAGMSQGLIPETDGHDFIGTVAIGIENRCGYVSIAWVSPYETPTEAGKITSSFSTEDSFDEFESRLVVHDLTNQFWPNDVDWTPFAKVGATDEFWWDANGTSGSRYTYRLRSKVTAAP